MGKGLIPLRRCEDVDPARDPRSLSSRAEWKTCFRRELLPATFDIVTKLIATIGSPGLCRKLYALCAARHQRPRVARSLSGRVCAAPRRGLRDRRPRGWRGWGRGRLERSAGAGNISGTCPHLDRSRIRHCDSPDVAAGKRRHARTLPRRGRMPGGGDGITLRDLPTSFGVANLSARRGDHRRQSFDIDGSGAGSDTVATKGRSRPAPTARLARSTTGSSPPQI